MMSIYVICLWDLDNYNFNSTRAIRELNSFQPEVDVLMADRDGRQPGEANIEDLYVGEGRKGGRFWAEAGANRRRMFLARAEAKERAMELGKGRSQRLQNRESQRVQNPKPVVAPAKVAISDSEDSEEWGTKRKRSVGSRAGSVPKRRKRVVLSDEEDEQAEKWRIDLDNLLRDYDSVGRDNRESGSNDEESEPEPERERSESDSDGEE